MLKKLATLLALIVVLVFIGTTLYVFEIPPFKDFSLEKLPTFTQEPSSKKPGKVARKPKFNERITRGDNHFKKGLTDLAIKEYQAANEAEPRNAIPILKIGEVHLFNKNFAKAQESFEEAIARDPHNIQGPLSLGKTFLAQRKIVEAKGVFEGIKEENETAIYYQALLNAFTGNHNKSTELLRKARDLNTSEEISTKSQKILNAYEEFARYQDGQETHRKTLLARSFNEVEEYQIAIPLLFEVIREQHDYRDAWIILGYSYLKIEQYSEAADALTEAQKLDPQKPETAFFLGLSYFGLNELDQAITEIETAIANGFEPKIQAEQKLAEIYMLQKNYKKAAQSYENVLALNNSDINYFIRPIWLYIEKLNQPQKALKLASTANFIHQDDPMSHNLLGWAYYADNNLSLAKKTLNHALTMDPELDAAHLNLGRVYEQEENYELAKNAYQKAYKLGNGNAISNTAAHNYNILAQKTTNSLFQVNVTR